MSNQKGCLTNTDREYLRGEKEYDSKQARYNRRKSIRDGARGALRDFHLLADELPDEEREKIFAAVDDPRSQRYSALQEDVSKTIEFLYAGMGGISGFRNPLIFGAANGEHTLGNVESSLDIRPQFTLDRVYEADSRETAALVEAEEWNRLNPPDLFSFIRLAHTAGAIDFDAIRDRLDFYEWAAQFTGKKRRAIPGGKQTPLMNPEVYDREGVGEMSVEELHDLFGEGYPVGSRIVYDGEKVYAPPPPGSDEDREVLDRIHDDTPDDE